MKGKFIALFALFLITMLTAVSAIPISVDRVEINDIEITEGQTNRLDLERGMEHEIEVILTPSQNVDDVEIEVFISGFEHNDRLRLADHIGPIDMDANVTYIERLYVKFSDFVDEDDYRLRLIITDRNNDEIVINYPIKVDVARHDLKIVDVLFTPNKVKAGQALLAVVRVENFGERDEDDVKVMINIPEIGVSASDYIEEIEADEEEESEELFLKIPKCTEPGIYEVQVIVEYNNRFSRTGAKKDIEVLEDLSCAPAVTQESVEVQVEATPEESEAAAEAAPKDSKAKVRSALEIILLVLIALLVVIGLIIGLTKMGSQEE